MSAVSRQNTGTRICRGARRAGLALALLGPVPACSGDGSDTETSNLPNFAGQEGEPGPSVTLPGGGVAGYNRPAGMPIGRGAPSGAEAPEVSGPAAAAVDVIPPDPDELEIPDFEAPEDEAAPCSGCVELNVRVNDINQSSDFAFNVGGASGVTRVVWTILVPFNSDQLFIRSVINGQDGDYTVLSANAFRDLDTPVSLVHEFAGVANSVGLKMGSSGAWTGDMRMSIFVDSVTFEGADPSANRTFDGDAQGFAPLGTEREPMVVFHP